MSENLWETPSTHKPAAFKLQALWIILGGVFSFLLGSLLLPQIAAALSQPLSALDAKIFWYISRGSGIIAFAMLWLSMLLGLLMTTRTIPRGGSFQAANELHKFISWLGLIFILVHAMILIMDEYIQVSIWQVFIPFTVFGYRPLSVGGGQIAFYMWLVLLLSFYIRRDIGQRTWRVIHYLSFAMFWIVLAHGIFSGTDTGTWGMNILYWSSAASVLMLTIYRIMRAIFA